VDDAKIADPADVKPAGYDDIAAEIPDSEASKPEDWDNEEDGKWKNDYISIYIYVYIYVYIYIYIYICIYIYR
jgi:hypothetical protein